MSKLTQNLPLKIKIMVLYGLEPLRLFLSHKTKKKGTMRMNSNTQRFAHTYTHARTHVLTHSHTFARTHTNTQTQTHRHRQTDRQTDRHTHTYTHTHTHTHTHRVSGNVLSLIHI